MYLGIVKDAVTGKSVYVAYVGPDPAAAQAAAAAYAAIMQQMGKNVNTVILTAPVYVP